MGNTLSTSTGSAPLWALSILEFASWDDRQMLMGLNKALVHQSQDQNMFRFLIRRLAAEHGLYIPRVLPKSEGSWRALFLEMFPRRDLWSVDEVLEKEAAVEEDEIGLIEEERFILRAKRMAKKRNSTTDRFKVNVYARFRPHSDLVKQPKKKLPLSIAEDVEEKEEEEEETKVTLPLHQRLSMIRMSGGAKTNRAALRVLASEGEWFGAKWSNIQKNMESKQQQQQQLNEDMKENSLSSSSNSQDEESAMSDELSLSDYAQLRKGEKPLRFAKGANAPTIAKVQSVDSGMGRVVMIAPDVGLREFSYDGVLPVHASQSSSYDLLARRLVMDFINGWNSTCIAYGQTAAGKTHTMMGPGGGIAEIGRAHV